MARVMRVGKRHQKNVSLAEHGGDRARAEEAAMEWLTPLLRRLSLRLSTEGRMSARNTSGEVGVKLSRKVFSTKGFQAHDYCGWTANWARCEFAGGVSWSRGRYGR